MPMRIKIENFLAMKIKVVKIFQPLLFVYICRLKAIGEVSEWLKEHAWKACVRETVPRVRIPLSPLSTI